MNKFLIFVLFAGLMSAIPCRAGEFLNTDESFKVAKTSRKVYQATDVDKILGKKKQGTTLSPRTQTGCTCSDCQNGLDNCSSPCGGIFATMQYAHSKTDGESIASSNKLWAKSDCLPRGTCPSGYVCVTESKTASKTIQRCQKIGTNDYHTTTNASDSWGKLCSANN